MDSETLPAVRRDRFAVAGVHVEVRPDHRPGQRRDVEHDRAVLEDAHDAGIKKLFFEVGFLNF